MAEDHAALSPFVLFEYDHAPGSFCLLLSDAHMVALEEHFNARGYEGNGYGWTGVARQLLRVQAPELEGRMRFDPEAGTFCAYGEDEGALRALGELMRQAWGDPERLGALIEGAEAEWLD